MSECCDGRAIMAAGPIGRVRTVPIVWSDGEMHKPCEACEEWMDLPVEEAVE